MLPVLTKQSLPTNLPPHVRSGVRAVDQLIRELGGGKLDAGQNRLLSLLALSSTDDERINDLLTQMLPEMGHSGRAGRGCRY